jgi:hypothetical protein
MAIQKHFKTILAGSISKFFFLPDFNFLFFSLFIQLFFFNTSKKAFTLLLLGSCLLTKQAFYKTPIYTYNALHRIITINIKDAYLFIYLFNIFYLTKLFKFNPGVYKFMLFNFSKYYTKISITFNSFFLLPELDVLYEMFEDSLSTYLVESSIRLNFNFLYGTKLIEYLFRNLNFSLKLFDYRASNNTDQKANVN